jgi:hypothetical protein
LTPADFQDDPNSVFQIGMPPARIDILPHIDGVTFDEAWPKRTVAEFGDVQANVISAEHLIQNKSHTGRLRDLADAEAIREANPGTNSQ